MEILINNDESWHHAIISAKATRRNRAELNNNPELATAFVTENETYPPIQKLSPNKLKTFNFSALVLFPRRTCPRNVPISLVIPEKCALRTILLVKTEVTLF
mmetsp:Transcript_13830/g.22712  ORF Transcript_13830/g.22712 Transcript_13830/m.22712 type:complete len:102 (-) Transcript_13830:831-1136(-)